MLAKLEGEGPPTGSSVDVDESISPLRVVVVIGLGWGCVKNFVSFFRV